VLLQNALHAAVVGAAIQRVLADMRRDMAVGSAEGGAGHRHPMRFA
jgi:hypothetical protein